MSDSPTPKPGTPSTHPRRDLFLASFVVLFFELACIRWFGAHVVFLTFFTNIVLMACFLGMSVGCLIAAKGKNFVPQTLNLTALAMVAAWVLFLVYHANAGLTVDMGSQRSPQVIFFGTENRPADLARFVIPIELIAGAFFALIALIFVGLGQVLGRSFDAIPDRASAYVVNILGSLAGIAAFGLCSLGGLGPNVWFAICVFIMLAFDRPWGWRQLIAQAVVLFLAAVSTYTAENPAEVFWSPYYKISYEPQQGHIETNHISHQRMFHIAEDGPAYVLSHVMNHDAGGAPFEDVLVIGAGSGNDVAAALALGAQHVDAVEIDPAIYAIGRRNHPDHPYADPRVSVHFDDGRSFVKRTPRKYDLVVYALVDSLVLHSGYSSIRLESFLFTSEAFAEVRQVLKPGGMFIMYNYYRQGWVVGRLEKMAENTFGSPPLVMSFPYLESIAPGDRQGTNFTVLLTGDSTSDRLRRIRERFAAGDFFWLASRPANHIGINAFGANPPAGDVSSWNKIGPARVDATGVEPLPSDAWPFLYLRTPTIPGVNLRGMAVIALLSLLLLWRLTPLKGSSPNWQMFFLGAGFMLLETKAVVHMALLFGSTWMVNTVVFFAILLMTLASSLFVVAAKPTRLWPYYVGLFIGLSVNVAVPMDTFLALPGALKTVASSAVLFLPVLFAGVIFTGKFRESARPDADLGYNIAGVVLGGLSESLSLVLGFDRLLYVAIAFYAASAIFAPRRVPSAAPTAAAPEPI